METLRTIQEIIFDYFVDEHPNVLYTSNLAVTYAKSDFETIVSYFKSEFPDRDIRGIVKNYSDDLIVNDDFDYYDVTFMDKEVNDICHRYYRIYEVKMLQ